MTGLKSFKRGIHPPHRKHYSEALPIELFTPRKDLLIPLVQHIGAPCKATVKPRQDVRYGDLIADVEHPVAAPIHATINGKTAMTVITSIPGGNRVEAIPIKLPDDEESLPPGFLQQFLDRNWGGVEPSSYEPDEICVKIRAGGLVGLGGATFPTHIKLKKNPDRPVDTLLLNGCECEPYLTSDHRMMLECPEAIVVGLQLARRAVGAERAIIAIESNKPDAIEAMRKAAGDRDGVEICVCATKYPMGGERQLIPAVLGRKVPSAPKGLPLDVGVVVVNVATAHGIAHAVVHGRPLTHRVVSVTGGGVNKPGNYLVPVGTIIADLLDHCGSLTEGVAKVLAGGPMMGPTLPNLDIPVIKGCGGLTAMTAAETASWREKPCIRCGSCVDNCPLYLSPTKIAQAVKHRDWDFANQYDMMACCECGCCAYVCPADIPLAQYIRAGKAQWRVIAAGRKTG